MLNISRIIISLTIVCFAIPSFAQSFGGAFEGLGNSDEPIQIEADNLEVVDGQGLAKFNGNVTVVQGTTILKAASLKVFYLNSESSNANPNSRIRKIEAGGKRVAIRSGNNYATADEMVVDMLPEIVTMRGDVVVSQGSNTVNGCVLIVHLKTNNATLKSCEVDNQKTEAKEDRVKILFTQKSNNN